MLKLLQYYGRFQGARGDFARLPMVARGLIAVVALPGLLLAGLSIGLLLVSLFLLFIMTVPVYRMLAALFVRPGESVDPNLRRPGRRQVDVKIVE